MRGASRNVLLAVSFALILFARDLAAAPETITYQTPTTYAADKDHVCLQNNRQIGEADEKPISDPYLYRCEPTFPRNCLADANANEQVDVFFRVSVNGVPDRVQVLKTTNECVNDAAVVSVFKWRFEKTEGDPRGFKTTVLFETPVNERIVYEPPKVYPFKRVAKCSRKFSRPRSPSPKELAGERPTLIVACPPSYPEKCFRRSKSMESVKVRFDVSPQGRPTNIRVVGTTNECHNYAAAKSVARWRYERSEQTWPDIETTTTFELNV